MRPVNDQQAAAIAARGQVFVSAGAGTGKTTVLVERFAEAVCERGLDVDSMLVITYTERARTGSGAAPRARPPRPGSVARRCMDLDDPWLLPAALEGSPVRCRRRSSLPGARRQPGPRHPRRGVRDGAERVLCRRGSGAPAAARNVRRLRSPPHAHDRLRDPPLGRTRAPARAGRAPGTRGTPSGAPRSGAGPRCGLCDLRHRRRLAASRSAAPASQ